MWADGLATAMHLELVDTVRHRASLGHVQPGNGDVRSVHADLDGLLVLCRCLFRRQQLCHQRRHEHGRVLRRDAGEYLHDECADELEWVDRRPE